MLFISWIVANIAYFFAASKSTENAQDPIGSSWLVIIGWAIMQAIFLGIWIF